MEINVATAGKLQVTMKWSQKQIYSLDQFGAFQYLDKKILQLMSTYSNSCILDFHRAIVIVGWAFQQKPCNFLNVIKDWDTEKTQRSNMKNKKSLVVCLHMVWRYQSN